MSDEDDIIVNGNDNDDWADELEDEWEEWGDEWEYEEDSW